MRGQHRRGSGVLSSVFLCLLFAISHIEVAAQEVVSSSKLAKSIDDIDESIILLKSLVENTGATTEADAEALVFRLDQRIIRLVADIAKLTRHISALPEDDPDRRLLQERVPGDLSKADQVLIQRIQQLDERIETNNERYKNAAEVEKYALQAHGNGLETLRLGFYSSLVELIESKEIIGLSAAVLRQKTSTLLYQYAETISARIELYRTTLREMDSRLALDANNTGVQGAANEIKIALAVEVRRLESLLKLMVRIEIDTVVYRSVLLRESSGVSLRLFDPEALRQTLEDSWGSVSDAVSRSLPDIFLKVLAFVLILTAFRALSQLVKRVVSSALIRSGAEFSTLLKDVLISVSGASVMMLGILVALSQVGISLGPALAGLGVAGFIVGFALQDTLGNFAAGGMILFYRPYDVDDFVEVAGTIGLVKKMTLVSTTINTFDNQTLIIPNSKIWGDVIKNVTAQKTRRVDLEFGVSYSDDIEKTERVLREIVESHEKVLTDPAPNIRLHTLGDSSVNFVVRPWTKTPDYWEVYWDITREVKMRFDREGISIPFPQRDVHFYKQDS
ncbi:MAG: mechanosensitive ion channel family protein [Halieaceae bacterium]|jgi:small conductance mechanosensitive channel|nr:mechanosensitive ion channel family protein [Halieaceae bacterium]MBT7721103.1 mechanosensitive ion channel family protein [Halieaceae bacterium]